MNCFSKSIFYSILLITATVSVASASTKENSFDIAQADSQPERIIENGNFKLELKDCSRNSNKEVICDFTITNLTGQDKTFPLASNLSQGTDSFGNRYSLLRWTVSNQGYNGKVVPDIPTAARITFAIPSKVDSFKVLDIKHFYSKGTFRFRDVEIQGSAPANSNTISTNNNNPERWLTMGKTNDGNIVSLDINSIQNQSGSLKFRYRITDNAETRERIAVTNVCRNGKISSQPEWKVEFQEKVLVIEANSPGSLNLLKRVCSSV